MITITNPQASWTKWDEQWCVLLPEDAEAAGGATVTVVSRNGDAKEVKLGEALGSTDYGNVWSIAKPEALENGYYLIDGGIFKVRPTKDGERQYGMRLSVFNGRGKWEYEQGAMRLIREQGVKLTVEEAAAFGHLHGLCAVCGRTLTDPKSVERGIGPVCAGKL